MQRRSYYPQNQQLVSQVSTSSVSRPVTPNTTLPGDADVVRADSVDGSAYGYKPSHEHHHGYKAETPATPLNDVTSEKGLAC